MTVAPQYTYTQLMEIIDLEAASCAANRKSGFKNLFTRVDTLQKDCKNGLIQGKYAQPYADAIAYENYNAAGITDTYKESLGISKQTMGIIFIALVVLLIIAGIYMYKDQ